MNAVIFRAGLRRYSTAAVKGQYDVSFRDMWDMRHDMIVEYANGDPAARSLKDILRDGEIARSGDEVGLIGNASHLHKALTVRIAKSLRGFNVLPDTVQEHENVRGLAARLIRTLDMLHEFDKVHGVITTAADELRFVSLLRDLANKDLLGNGDALLHLREMVGKARGITLIDPTFFDHFVGGLLLNSVSWVVLIQHHLQLSSSQRGKHHVGAFDTRLRPVAVARDCAFRTQTVCVQQMGKSPRIEVKGDLQGTMEYIEAHFRYVITEVMKNSAHATVRRYQEKGKETTLPPVSVTVNSCDEEVEIRVRDMGGGMNKNVLHNVWRFGYTTASDLNGLGGEEAESGSGLAGWGFGLPRSLVYTKYLGGDIRIENDHGTGCSVVITIPKAASDKSFEFLNNI